MSDTIHIIVSALTIVFLAMGALLMLFYRSAMAAALLRITVLESDSKAIGERLRKDELDTKDLEKHVAVERERTAGMASQFAQRMSALDADIGEVKTMVSTVLSRLPSRSYSPGEYPTRKDPR